MTHPFCHCEERQRRSNLVALTLLRGTLSFCSATLQGRAHEAKASHYISKLCSVILHFDFCSLPFHELAPALYLAGIKEGEK